MIKVWQIFTIVFIVIAAIFFLVKHERESAENEVVIEQQKEKIEIQNEVIKDKKIISQRQAVARAVSTNDNLVWLRQYRCKDCESR